MMPRLGAASVHVLTASGTVLALLALRAVHQSDWQMMFVWLGAALIVDAVDGPIARWLSAAAIARGFIFFVCRFVIDEIHSQATSPFSIRLVGAVTGPS